MSASVFPARAGMSRVAASPAARSSRVPRASGDEPPPPEDVLQDTGCSPRERG